MHGCYINIIALSPNTGASTYQSLEIIAIGRKLHEFYGTTFELHSIQAVGQIIHTLNLLKALKVSLIAFEIFFY